MLLSSSNRKYQPYPLSCFSVVVYLRCLLHHVLSLFAYTFRENRDFVFIIIVQFMMDANSQIRFGSQIVFVKMPVRHILSSLWVILSIFSQLSTIQYMGLCVFSLLFSLVMIERIYTLSYHHYKIGCMNCYPLFRVRLWNNGMCCMSLYILLTQWRITFSLFFITLYIYLNASQCDNTLLSFTLFSCLK